MEYALLIVHVIPLLVERGFKVTTAVFAVSIFGPMQVVGRIILMFTEKHSRSNAQYIYLYWRNIRRAGFTERRIEHAVVLFFVATQGVSFGLNSILKPVDKLGCPAFGAISGWLAMTYLANEACGPYVGGVLWQISGYTLALWAKVVMSTMGFILVLTLVRIM